MSKELRQNDAKKFIHDENVNMCAFIETHMKTKNIKKVGDKVFRDWNWDSNVQQTLSCCRIMVGWNPRLVKVLMINKSKQDMLCYMQVVKNDPWVIMGDFNVTLNTVEHSSGSSRITMDMAEFNDTINNLEVEDICSSGFQFTWTKSLKNPRCKILKKLDRILINDAFLQKFQAHGVFLPYMVSDHSLLCCILRMDFLKRKVHLDFIVKKLKKLKRPLKKLSWANGNVFDNVMNWKDKLKSAQAEVDKNPHDEKLIKDAILALNEFVEASKDEMKILQQKSRRNKSRVEFTKDDASISYEGEAVNEQFVNHFEKFFGKVDHVTSIDDSIFKNSLSDKEAISMIGDVTDKEIKEVMFDIDSNKASRPDGFTFEFFKKACGTVSKVSEKNGSKRCAMQIDMQKAYDTVSWSFLEDILGKFGFHKKMITWIMTCVKSISFSIYLNGDMHGFFKGGRGLRQDDLLVLCKGNRESIEVIKKSLDEFSQVSGLIPNLSKSIIFFESINERDKIDLLQVLPFKCGKLPVRYLGVPLLAKKLGVSDCKVLCDKVEEIINNWRNKTLSYAGRIQLIAYVLSSMQQYWALVYLLPATVIHDLEKLFKRFLWNAGDSAKAKLESHGKWDRIRDHVWYEIGNGNNVSMWYDKWCIDGPLSSVISRRDIYDARTVNLDKLLTQDKVEKWDHKAGRKRVNNIGNAVDKLVLAATVVRSKLMIIKAKQTLRTNDIARKWDLQWRNQYLIVA
ncbi:RNA-directed DNA polymerase, eukaryota, reverse transcriptase zinc-binding domain protein [Tanacetum coccineum]